MKRTLIAVLLFAALFTVAACGTKAKTTSTASAASTESPVPAATLGSSLPSGTPQSQAPETQKGVLTTLDISLGSSGPVSAIAHVTLKSGEKVKATCTAKMVNRLRAGQTLEIQKTQVNGQDAWTVTRIVKSP
jgi:hypothetical protein